MKIENEKLKNQMKEFTKIKNLGHQINKEKESGKYWEICENEMIQIKNEMMEIEKKNFDLELKNCEIIKNLKEEQYNSHEILELLARIQEEDREFKKR